MPPDRLQLALSNRAAEEILQLVYGDDLSGCTVSVDSIAQVIGEAMAEDAGAKSGLLEAHERAVEAFLVLTTPPEQSQVASPADLQMVLSDRLDRIRTLAEKLRTLTVQVNRPPAE